jgi:hypothetical protein
LAGMVIGLCGYAGSGKSEAAKYLAEAYGFERRHMGAPLKAMLKTGFGLTDDEIDGAGKEVPCAKLLGVTPRRAQIELGTKFGRGAIHPNIWVETFKRGVKVSERIVNESIRFPNEAETIHSLGGYMIRLHRGGLGPIAFRWGCFGKFLYAIGIMAGVHPSERVDRLEADYTINNPTGSIEFLRHSIDEIMAEIGVDGVDANIKVAA